MGLFDGPLKCSRFFRKGLIKRIHINQHNIKKNVKEGNSKESVITCKMSSENVKCKRLEILGDEGETVATIVYSPDQPLSCGARVWVETTAEVRTEDW